MSTPTAAVSVSEPLIQASLLGEAIDHAPVAVLVADDSLRYVVASAAAAELLGYAREELLALHVADVARSDEAQEALRRCIENGEATGEADLTRKDGSAVRVAFRAARTRLAHMEAWLAVVWPV